MLGAHLSVFSPSPKLPYLPQPQAYNCIDITVPSQGTGLVTNAHQTSRKKWSGVKVLNADRSTRQKLDQKSTECAVAADVTLSSTSARSKVHRGVAATMMQLCCL